jgi:predicted ATPase/transcriptional regulator with XRE-family HTH domain
VDTGTGLTFGNLLRRHRNSAGLTQEDLAERAGLTPQAIGLLERGERRRPHKHTVRKLAEVLGLGGQDLTAFEATARPPARRAAEIPRRALPVSLTPLVGREHEVTDLTGLLRREDVRLLTLTGPGGVGKTRLAIEAAGLARESFADGVVFVPLAPLRDPALVPSAVAEALGVREAADRTLLETLEHYLRDRQTLVLLDNFEHLLAAVPMVAELMGTCQRLTALVTSRAPLRLTGEHQFPVSPLPLPEAGTPPPPASVPARSAAVELFCQRARAVAPTFELTAANAAAVAQICRRLDGLPLAIELAAARVKLFSPRALLDRLDRGLQLLGGGARDLPERQQTLRGTVAWSYDLLDTEEQAFFRRLSVFAGGCTLGAAEVVCRPGTDAPEDGDVLQGLASLVDNSLVSRSEAPARGENEEPRFTMLETIREYAVERLESSGEAEEMHRAHALYYMSLAEAAQPEVSMHLQEEWWWTQLEEEHDNLRAALRWAVRVREAETATRLALALWRFWNLGSHPSEGRRWLEAVLALEGAEGRAVGAKPALPARRRAFLRLVTGILSAAQGDDHRAVELYEESLTFYERLGHRKGTSGPLRELGAAAYRRKDYEQAAHLNERALTVAREFGSRFGAALALCNLADVLRDQGDLEGAKSLLEESLASLRSQEGPLRIANALVNTLARLGSIECEMGRDARASELFEESLGEVWRFGFGFEGVACLEGLARVAAMQGRPGRAARLLGSSAARREEMGVSLSPIVRADHDHAVNAARAALGEDAFTSAWAFGHAMSVEEAITDALGGNE